MNRAFSFIKLCLLCVFLASLSCCSKTEKGHPFEHDMHISKLQRESAKATICFHGMGGDYQIIDYVKDNICDDSTLISFNFPDYGINLGSFDPDDTFIGTIEEVLAAVYVLKQAVLDDHFKVVSLYGYSAGGGSIINTLMMLNTSEYDSQLKQIGISKKDKKKIIKALEKGSILLDAPLKSVAEIRAFRPPMKELDIIGDRFATNHLEPIENIYKLKGMKLDIIVNFQVPDEVLSNRDDLLYIERLKEVNKKGKTLFVIEGEGHSLPHPHLWDLHKATL